MPSGSRSATHAEISRDTLAAAAAVAAAVAILGLSGLHGWSDRWPSEAPGWGGAGW